MKIPQAILLAAISGVFVIACESIHRNKIPVDKEADPAPKLKRPEVRKIWVPDEIIGDEYISGHFKFVLQKNASWAKEN